MSGGREAGALTRAGQSGERQRQALAERAAAGQKGVEAFALDKILGE